jgi:hypothetical protein
MMRVLEAMFIIRPKYLSGEADDDQIVLMLMQI